MRALEVERYIRKYRIIIIIAILLIISGCSIIQEYTPHTIYSPFRQWGDPLPNEKWEITPYIFLG